MKKLDKRASNTPKKTKVAIYLFRSLYSQSAASLSAGKLSQALLAKGYQTEMHLLKLEDYIENQKHFQYLADADIIVYKTNYKDFEYGIRLFKNMLSFFPEKKLILCGAFAIMNKDRILLKWPFIDDVINVLNAEEVTRAFPVIGSTILKETVVNNVDREIEYEEKGRYVNLEASEGCMYKCNFCHVHLLKYPYNVRDLDLLITEIDYLVNSMGKKYLIFNDSIFWKGKTDNKRILAFCQKIKAKKIQFHFLIYLTLYPPITEDVLQALVDIGLVRVFFGVENITNDFQINNPKKVSGAKTKKFIELLESYHVSYHIGFMLFFPEVKFENLYVNLTFLYEIKKLFRIGILLEKMRILPKSKNAERLYDDQSQVDQAYNYQFDDQNVQNVYDLFCVLFSVIDIRFFEAFFTSVDLVFAILKKNNRIAAYEKEIALYKTVRNHVNQTLYDTLREILRSSTLKSGYEAALKDLYSLAESMYLIIFTKLAKEDLLIFEMIPHGKEQLNR